LNAGEGDTLDGLDVSNIKNKATALVLAKTKGESGEPVGLHVVNAKLADVKVLLANKQVNEAKIADTARNMLAFSADKFTMLAKAKTVSFAITDNATNIGKYGALLVTAVDQFKSDMFSLDVKDTAANLTTNLEKLDKLATIITGADEDGQSEYDKSRIKIQQIKFTAGVESVDKDSNIKVAYSNYSDRRDVLQYIKDSTTDMLQEHVEIDTTAPDTLSGDIASEWSLQRAKDISNTLQLQRFIADPLLVSATPPDAPDSDGNAVTLTKGAVVTGAFGFRSELGGGQAIVNDTKTFGFSGVDRKTWATGAKTANQLYSDIAKIGISLQGVSAAADSALVKADKDLMTGPGNFLKTGLTTPLTMKNVYA
jgi:hypothetical protein